MSVGLFADLFDPVTWGDRGLTARLRAGAAPPVPAPTGSVAL